LHEHFAVSTFFAESIVKEIVQHLIENQDLFLKLQQKSKQFKIPYFSGRKYS